MAHAADSDEPCSRSSRTATSTLASVGFSTWAARMLKERTTDNPESTMVESWRVNTATSRSFTLSEKPGILISVLRLTVRFWCHRYGHVAHVAEPLDDQRHAVAIELSLDETTRPVSYLVVECQCHGSPLPAPVARLQAIMNSNGFEGLPRSESGRRRCSR